MRSFLWSLWRNFLQRRSVDGELDAEVLGYLQLLVDEKVADGLSMKEARRMAKVELGGEAQVRQAVRDGRVGAGLEMLWQDVRYGWRMLMRSKGFALVAVLSLGLGIGANTAIFTVAKRVLFDTLPVAKPHELRMLTWVSGHERPVPPVWGDVSGTPAGGLTSNSFSYPVVEALRKQTDAYADLFAFKNVQMTAVAEGRAEIVEASMVSGNIFDALGVRPLLGRALMSADDVSGGSPVAVIGEGYWAARFGRAESALGKVIRLNGQPVTVVGVLPARFTGLEMGKQTEVYVPLTAQPLVMPRAQNGSVSLLNNPQSWWLQAMVRLRPDVPEARVQAELDAVLRSAAKATVSTGTNGKTGAWDLFHLVMTPGERGVDYLHGTYAGPSYVLMGLAGLVLLLACVNLANLLLARAAARQREMSTRMALGAGRMRILRQVLTESLLLSGMGGVVGLALGYAGRNLIPFMLAGRDAPMGVDFDWRVMAFTIAVAVLTGVLFGVAPAWRAVRADVNASLKDGSAAMGGPRGAYVGKGLVVVQIALSTILLMGAGLFARTLSNLNDTKLGFEVQHLLLFRLNPPRIRYDDAQTMALYGRIEARLAALPGVRSVAMSNIAIMGDGGSGSTFHVTGTPQEHEPMRVQSIGVSADFLQTMGIPMVEGRGFTAQDTAASPKVAVVNQALARQFFPKGDAVGRTFEADAEDIEGPVTIVGIAADTRYDDLRSATPPTFYIDYKQQVNAGKRVVEIRTVADPGSVLSEVRAVIAAEDRDLPLIDVRTMTEQVATTVAQERVFAQLTSGFGVLALVLASIGIYGIMAYTVAARTGEIGIRMALGAQAERVLGMVLREVSWMALVGVVLGLGGALMLARLVSSMLYGVTAFDPLTLVGVTVVLMGISLLAGFGPARRASRIDPVRALRHE